MIKTTTKTSPQKREFDETKDENCQGDMDLSYTSPSKLLQTFFRKISKSTENLTHKADSESHAKGTAGPVSIDKQRAARALRALRREQNKNNAGKRLANTKSKARLNTKQKSVQDIKENHSDPKVSSESDPSLSLLLEPDQFGDMAQTAKQAPSTMPRRSAARLSYVPNCPAPNTKQAKSKVGSLQYINYMPKGGDIKIPTHKINISTKSKIGSLDNVKHTPGGGKNLKILDKNEEDKNRIKQVGSKCDSLANISHTPQGGNVRIVNKKFDYKQSVSSKCGSLDNANYKPKKSDVLIENKKISMPKVGSKIGSLDNTKHTPKGGNIKIFNQKIDYGKVGSKTGSLMNINHKPGGGDVIVYDEHNASTRALADQLKSSMILEDDLQQEE